MGDLWQGLFRSSNHKKLADFMSRDFSTAKNKDAACKNAFVLLGQHRPELAAAFFVLGLPVMSALLCECVPAVSALLCAYVPAISALHCLCVPSGMVHNES